MKKKIYFWGFVRLRKVCQGSGDCVVHMASLYHSLNRHIDFHFKLSGVQRSRYFCTITSQRCEIALITAPKIEHPRQN